MKKLSILAVLVALTGALAFAAPADAHGWHWTKCRNGARWIRGHNKVNWYGPWYNCSGTWEIWEFYYTSKIWP